MSIIEQIERRTNRAFAEMTGRTLIEDMTPTEQKAALEDDIEQKVRYVRTPAGVRRFGQPIGSIIVRDVVGSLGRIRVKNPVFKGFELVEDKKGNLYDVGKDDTNGKYVALKHNTWDDQIEPADSLDDALKALNDKLGGGSSDEGEKPAPKAKKPKPKKAPAPKEEPKESAASAKAREDALGIRNAMTATNGRIDGHEKAVSALLEKGTAKAERDAVRRHSELITEIEDQTRAAKNLKRNQATPQDVKDMMDLVIESEAGRKERATKARDAATKYAPKPKTSAPEEPSQSTNKAVTRDTPIGTPVRVAQEYNYPGKLNNMAGAVGTIQRRNKNGVTVSGGGIFTAPYDALEVISKADLERSKKAAGASKDMDLLSKQEGYLRDSMGRMEKASTLEKLEELNHDFTVQRARQITKAREIIKNPRTSDEDRKRAESIKGRLEAMDDDELALYERKKKELSAPAKSKGGSIGARGSKERDAFIAAHPKLKDVNDYHKPKIRDLDEKNFQAYLTAVEGGKSPDSIGAIMSRVAPGISWNPNTEKWSGQGSTKRPTSPTPTDTSASDAADRATREAVEKMRGEDRAKGRKNPYTSALTGTQQNAVNDLTPGEYATYMNARDGGSGHHEAMRKAKPAQGRTPLQEGRDTMRMHENASVERKPMMRLQNSFKVAAKKLQEDPDKVKRIRDNRLNTMEQSIKDRESRLADPRYSGALLDRDREAFTSNIERDKKILADVRKKIDAMPDESARERATDDFFGTTGLPKQSEADKGAERTLKFSKDARMQAGGIKVGPDLQRNIIKHRTALEGIEEAQERIRLSSRGLSDDMKSKVKQERENLDTHRDMLRRKIKGFEDQIQEDQDVDTRMRADRKKREAVDAQSRKFGNTNTFLAENDDLLKTIVRLGRSDKGDPSQLLPDVRERLAEINNRLSWTDDELGGYHKGAGREMSDTAAARHRAGLTDQKSKFETAEKLIDGRKPAPSAQDQPNDTMKMHQRASDARKPFVREENSFTAYTNMVEQGKVKTKRHGRTIIKTLEDSIARREERMKDTSMTDDLLPRDVQARKNHIKTDKRRLEASRKIVDKMPEDKPTAPYVPDSQKPSSSGTDRFAPKPTTPAPTYDERPGDPGDGPFRRGASKLRKAGVEDFQANDARRLDDMEPAEQNAVIAKVKGGTPIAQAIASDQPSAPARRFDDVRRTVDRKHDALVAERREFEKAGGTQAWLNKVGTVERYAALQKKFRDLHAEIERDLDPSAGGGMSADMVKRSMLREADHQANLIETLIGRSKASDAAKARAKAKAEGSPAGQVERTPNKPAERPVSSPTGQSEGFVPATREEYARMSQGERAEERRKRREAAGEPEPRGATGAALGTRLPSVDSTLTVARTQIAKARRVRSESSANDAIRTLDTTARELQRDLIRSGDRMTSEQRADIQRALADIASARRKAEEQTPVNRRTHLRPSDIPALNDQASRDRDYREVARNQATSEAVELFNSLPTRLPEGQRYGDPELDMGALANMADAPSVPALNRAIRALEEQEDTTVDDEIRVLKEARDYLKERADRERAEFESANTSLFDGLDIPEQAPSAPARPKTAVERAEEALEAYDEAHKLPKHDRGMESMRFHQTQRQRDKLASSSVDQAVRQVRERNKLEGDIRRAKVQERRDATPKTPVDPSTIKGADAVLIYNKNTKRADWYRVKRVNKTTVTGDGGGGGMDDPRFPHGSVVGVRKNGEVTTGSTEAPAPTAQDRRQAQADEVNRILAEQRDSTPSAPTPEPAQAATVPRAEIDELSDRAEKALLALRRSTDTASARSELRRVRNALVKQLRQYDAAGGGRSRMGIELRLHQVRRALSGN